MSSRANVVPATLPSAKPGLFASHGEKELFKAWTAQDGPGAEQAGLKHSEFELPAFTLAGFLIASNDGDRALKLFERAFELGDAANTEFFRKYVHGWLEIGIAQGVTAQVRPGRDAVGLALGELYQSDARIDEAINIVEQLSPTTYTAVSLAELYAQAGRYDDVISLTEGLSNQDDATALLLVFRGVAFHEQKHLDAAHETFKQALKSRSRDAAIRNHALFERARNYLAQGKAAMARKDLERILADDSDYPELREQLDALPR